MLKEKRQLELRLNVRQLDVLKKKLSEEVLTKLIKNCKPKQVIEAEVVSVGETH